MMKPSSPSLHRTSRNLHSEAQPGKPFESINKVLLFLSGIDGTRAFVTGEFDEKGLIDDISGLSPLQLGELEDWVKFYKNDYTYVGKLIGRYYTREGSPTKDWYHYQKKLGERDLIKAEQRKLEQQFPGCNSQWTEATQGKVYCSNKRYLVISSIPSDFPIVYLHKWEM